MEIHNGAAEDIEVFSVDGVLLSTEDVQAAWQQLHEIKNDLETSDLLDGDDRPSYNDTNE